VKPVVRRRVRAITVTSAMAGRQAEIDDAAPIEAGAAGKVAEVSTISLDLATDCLRLSTHFFHPIQQCAQQVYHTPLPLSPTSSQLLKSCFRSAADRQLSCVTAFSGAPDKWGLLLRTIDIRPRQLTCVGTLAQRIVAACEDTVNVYDAVTFVLRQSLHAPEAVTKIQGSPEGSTLFFAHSYSATMWDVQTGGLAHTFATRSEITDIAVSATGGYIACGSVDGSVTFWDTHTKEENKGFGNGQPVVTIRWLPSLELAVATQNAVHIRNITTGKTSVISSIPGRVWGMVYSSTGRKLLVGVSQPGEGADQELCSLEAIGHIYSRGWQVSERQPQMHLGRLLSPTLVGDEIACVTPPSGVQSFGTVAFTRTNNPPLLDAATSVAVSLNRNLVAQTKDSIQIFSLDILKRAEIRNDIRPSHVYPLGEKHIVCLLQPTRHLTILELGSLRKLGPDDNTLSLGLLPTNKSPSVRASFSHGFVAEFGTPTVMEAWRSDTPLPEWTEVVDEDPPLSGLSPDCTQIVTFYGSPRRELRVKDAKDGTILANLPQGDDALGTGKVYDVTFDSATRFHLKIDEPGRHVRIPHDIIPSPAGPYSHAITKGETIPLSEPRATPPYTLDANCEWVVDAESRKVCWISPGNVRRGNGGHFWAGLSLVMVGDDGVVRKLSFRKPDN
jgi:WD40 repeat protein